jgi:hypothetical protein
MDGESEVFFCPFPAKNEAVEKSRPRTLHPREKNRTMKKRNSSPELRVLLLGSTKRRGTLVAA